jgi:hypothetical protein
MSDALKRINKARDPEFQDRVMFYMWVQAVTVLEATTPDTNDLALAKAIFAGSVKAEDMTRVVITNGTIGAKVDSDTAVLDSEIEYVVVTENKFNALAQSYAAAGEPAEIQIYEEGRIIIQRC